MSPDRLTLSQTSFLESKPYDRTNQLEVHTDTVLGVEDVLYQPGFPTYAQYKLIEACYVQSLSSKRQHKALISQELFDRVWDVLTGMDRDENAQFRFWARKMFKIVTLAEIDREGEFGDGTQRVLVHDGLLVAVQEKIYTLLCYFHGKTDHAGRDKTCAFIRRSYTYVPKDLVAQFIKACPTCKYKRGGRLEHPVSRLAKSAPPSPMLGDVHDIGTSSEPPSPIVDVSFDPVDTALLTAHPYGVLLGTNTGLGQQTAVTASAAMMQAIAPNKPTCDFGLHSLPMAREVSLYQGLPNGWQFHTDYATARDACIEMKKQQHGQAAFRGRPRVPSVAPMMHLIIQEHTEDISSGYSGSAQLWRPKRTEQISGRPQLYLDMSGDNGSSLYTFGEDNTLNAIRPSELLTSPNALTPDLIESNHSPFVTELSTPQDESTNELRSNFIFNGPKTTDVHNTTERDGSPHAVAR
ncbi:hypothetical protein APHAL10511_002415 [Amanita phalloides]|nr:hypothetical protein APHAL10511_002415 [Amanita phalloides]